MKLPALWIAIFSTVAASAAPLLVSGPAAPSVSAGGNSFNPVFSADGQKLVFVSHANNLVTNDGLGLWLDVFVRDIAGSNTVLVSVSTNGTGGANSDANYPSVSANGQFIAFSSRASNLVPGDTNDAVDVFVRDVVAGTTVLVSVDLNGNAPTDPNLFSLVPLSGNPMISTNGRYVVFESRANNLTADGVTTGDVYIYRRDLWSNITVRANAPVDISPATIQHELGGITPNGAFAGYSRRTNNSANSDAYVYQVGSGAFQASGGMPGLIGGPYRCSAPVVSDIGRFAAFYATPLNGGNTVAVHSDTWFQETWIVTSVATNLSHGLQISANGQRVLFEFMDGLYARPAIWTNFGGTMPIVCNGLDLRGNPAMTPDGSAVAYIGCSNVYFAGSSSNSLVSVATNGAPSGGDYQFVTPAISPDGTRVAFAVNANDLVLGDLNGMSDIFLRDVTTGVTELITKAVPSRPASTAFAHSFLGPNSISADGRFIVSTRYDDPSAWRDTNGAMDVFLSDKLLGTSHALSVDNNVYHYPDGGPSAGQPYYSDNTNSHSGPIISADGTTVAALRAKANGFNIVSTRSSNNVFGSGLFIAHRTDNPGGSLFGNGSSYAPSLSANGRDLVFTTTSTDFIFINGADINSSADVVLRRFGESNGVPMAANYLVSVTPGGVSGNNVSSNGIISPDGRWVIFESLASNLTADSTGGLLNLFARDLWSNVTHLVSTPVPGGLTTRFTSGTASYSGNSRFVCYSARTDFSQPGLYVVHDLQTSSKVYVPYQNTSFGGRTPKPSLSFEGKHMALYFYSGNFRAEIQVKNLTNGTADILDSRLHLDIDSEPIISRDGRYTVYRAKFPQYDFHINQIFVRDRLLGTTLIVSANTSGGAGNGPSTKPVLAANGRTVVFQSFASDLVAGDFNDMRDLFVLTLGGVDSEPDGMDDDWEMAYFDTLLRPGTGDFDGDGASDLAEFLAGTDPTNSNSIFRVLTVAPAGGGVKLLLWSGNPTRNYRAEFKDDLTAASWTALTGAISWNGTTASISDPSAGGATNRFYRVLRLP